MKNLLVQKSGGWVHLTLNRPEKKNALDQSLIKNLKKVFMGFDKTTQGVLLKGEGDCFCAGADLSWLKNSKKNSLDILFNLLHTIDSFNGPVAALAHGKIYGGGIGLLSVCDFIAAENNSSFCFSELKWGLAPALIAPFLFKKPGRQKSLLTFMLSARSFSCSKALESGLIDFAGSKKEIAMWTARLMQDLNSLNLNAFQETKKYLKELPLTPKKEIKTLSLRLLEKRLKDPLTKKSLQNFLKK